MEGPLHTMRRAAHAAMLDGRDWLAEEWRMLYLSPLATAVAFSIAFFFTPHLLAADLHVDEGVRKRGTEDWEREIKRLYGLCIKQTVYPERASISLLLVPHFPI